MKSRGFTLIEIAIVLVVIGLLLSGGLLAFASFAGASDRKVTEERLERVQKALGLYVIQHGCLPCPANGTAGSANAATYGEAADTAGTYSWPGAGGQRTIFCTANSCANVAGVLPWRTIGISTLEAEDVWGNALRYRIGTGLQQTDAMKRSGAGVFPAGDVVVNLNGTANSVTTAAAYVLASSGRDRSLAYGMSSSTLQADKYAQAGLGGGQDENSDGDATFAQGDEVSLSGVSHFDDIVVFQTGPLMVQLCGASACGNP